MTIFLLIFITPFFCFSSTLSLVDEKLEDLKTIKIFFVQKVKYRWFPDVELSKGIFYADRNGRFRVEYSYPEKITIVCDGDTIMVHYLEDEEVILDKLNNNKSSTIEAIFMFSQPLSEVFILLGEIVERDYKKLILQPKEKDGIIKEVSLYVDSALNIKGIEVRDMEGNEIYIEIRDIRKNYRPSKHLFDVLVPAGVAVRKTF